MHYVSAGKSSIPLGAGSRDICLLLGIINLLCGKFGKKYLIFVLIYFSISYAMDSIDSA